MGIRPYMLIIFLLLIPTQLGRHFWPEWSLIGGVRSDYLSPTLYLIDIIWIVWVIFNLPKSLFDPTSLFELRRASKRDFKKIIPLLGLVLINIALAGNWMVAIYKWGRILQFLITVKLVESKKLQVKSFLGWIIPIWIGVESLLGVAQLVNGGSIQGIWYWLGERRFELTTPGIAQMAVMGRGLVRAYGTFSHPNSMAGFLLISILIWNQITLPYGHPSLIKRVLKWVVNWLAIVGIVISGSRTVWILLGLSVVSSQFSVKNWKQRIGYFGVFVGVGLLILGLVGENYKLADFVGGWDKEGVQKRMELNMAAVKMIADNPLFGVGAGNFVAELPGYNLNVGKINWWQPVHNIILLGISEIGLLGMGIILWIFFKFKGGYRNPPVQKWVWGVILITGMVDHYWLTLPQNTWLLAVVMGMMMRRTEKRKGGYRNPPIRGVE